MNIFKKSTALFLILAVVFCISGCSKTKEVDSIIPSSKVTTTSKVVKDDQAARQLIRDYIYLNALDLSVYDNQSDKISSSIKKDGYYYIAAFKTVNGENIMCEKYFAVEKKTSKIFAVDKTGKMISVFEDKILGPNN